jgi:hypothetical protein
MQFPVAEHCLLRPGGRTQIPWWLGTEGAVNQVEEEWLISQFDAAV